MNFYNHHNSVSFKSHSISVTFRFCAVLVALRALEPRSTDSLGTQHHANFESHSNRVAFETNAIMMIVKVHPQYIYNLQKKIDSTILFKKKIIEHIFPPPFKAHLGGVTSKCHLYSS